MTTFYELAKSLGTSVDGLRDFASISLELDPGVEADLREAWAHAAIAAEEETAAGLADADASSEATETEAQNPGYNPPHGGYPDPDAAKPMYGQTGYVEELHATPDPAQAFYDAERGGQRSGPVI